MLCSSVVVGSVALSSRRGVANTRSRACRKACVARASAQGQDKPSITNDASSRRVALVGAAVTVSGLFSKSAFAEDIELPPKDYSKYNSGTAGAEQSELVKRLLAKSAENKSTNDAERKAGIDKTYDSYLAIAKGTGFVPEDAKMRKKLGITRPPECDLPFFKDSPTCAKF